MLKLWFVFVTLAIVMVGASQQQMLASSPAGEAPVFDAGTRAASGTVFFDTAADNNTFKTDSTEFKQAGVIISASSGACSATPGSLACSTGTGTSTCSATSPNTSCSASSTPGSSCSTTGRTICSAEGNATCSTDANGNSCSARSAAKCSALNPGASCSVFATGGECSVQRGSGGSCSAYTVNSSCSARQGLPGCSVYGPGPGVPADKCTPSRFPPTFSVGGGVVVGD